MGQVLEDRGREMEALEGRMQREMERLRERVAKLEEFLIEALESKLPVLP